MKIALITAEWHQDLLQNAITSCCKALSEYETSLFSVPGALEIPLFAQKLIKSQAIDAIIAFGFVVDGGIYRHEFVAQAVLDGFMRVQLDTGVPIISCVMTPQAFHEHADHQEFFSEHLKKKGLESAAACLGFLKAASAL